MLIALLDSLRIHCTVPNIAALHTSHRCRYQPVFPCILKHGLEHNYKVGYNHAWKHFDRLRRGLKNPDWILNKFLNTAALGKRAESDPRGVLEEIISRYQSSWKKQQLWIELGVLGSDVRATVTRGGRDGQVKVAWHNASWSPEWGMHPHGGGRMARGGREAWAGHSEP